MALAFEADLDPQSHRPRIRMNFSNGWSVSVVLMSPSQNGCEFLCASVAVCPTGQWGEGNTEIVAYEALACEVATILGEVSSREALS